MSIELPITSPVLIKWKQNMNRQESIFTNDPFASFEEEEQKMPQLIIEEESDMEGDYGYNSTDDSSMGQASPSSGGMSPFTNQECNFESFVDFDKKAKKANGLSNAIKTGNLKVD